MAKPLKVISINFPFKEQSVKYSPDLRIETALFDFDIVVIRPYALAGPDVRRGGRVEWSDFVALRKVRKKNDDFSHLLQSGGVLVIILDVVEAWTCRTGGRFSHGEIHTVTNYDFLDERLSDLVSNGTGDRVTIVDPTEPFAKVLKGNDVHWTAFMNGLPSAAPATWHVFAKNPAGIIGARLPAGQGHIILLPNFTHLDEREFFDACREYRFGWEASQPPEWATKVHLSGEADAAQKVVEIEREQMKLADARDAAVNSRDALLEFKRLLFEKGKAHLEPVVLRALDTLGFRSTASEIIAGTQFEIDGRTTVGSVSGIVEVKGSKNQIGLGEISPFIPKLLEDFKQRGVQSKGVLVGNGLCEQSPSTRLGNKVFTQHALDAARTSSVALVNSLELYWAVCGVLSGEISDCEKLRESILGSNGYVDLKSFLGTSPFAS